MSFDWLVQEALATLADFGRSDVAGHAPRAENCWLTTSFGHWSFGLVAALWRFPLGLRLGIWGGLLLKELLCDLPDAGYALWVLADSAVDLALPWHGWWLAQRRLRRVF